MMQSPFEEPVSSSTSRETPPILWTKKVHYLLFMSPPLVPVLSIKLISKIGNDIRKHWKDLCAESE